LPRATIVVGAHLSRAVSEMSIDQHVNDQSGSTRVDRIARQAEDAGEAARQRALSARQRGEAAGERAAEVREWGGHFPSRSLEATTRAANAAAAAQAAGERARTAYKRAATAHEDAADAHDRAAAAAEREGDMTRAIVHRQAAVRDRTVASADLSSSQQATTARNGYGRVFDGE
jgi:hypothetical protein